MELVQATKPHLLEIMTWFTNEIDFLSWSGPNFRYPYDLASFTEDLNLKSLASFSLVDEQNNIMAFGQYYLRLDKCHLGRLVVNPAFRGKGIAAQLIQQLIAKGADKLQVNSSSLFVYADNKQAVSAYEKFGFNVAKYPEKIPLTNCIYMIYNI